MMDEPRKLSMSYKQVLMWRETIRHQYINNSITNRVVINLLKPFPDMKNLHV